MEKKIDLHELVQCLKCIGGDIYQKDCSSCPYHKGKHFECCDLVIADAITVIECLIKREQVDKRDR